MLKKMKDLSAHDIYYKSPVFMQHVLTSAYGYKLKRERYNGLYRVALKNYVRGDIDKKQSLIRFMHHLKNNINVYKNIRIDENNIMNSFQKLPMTVKEDLRTELEDRSYKVGIMRYSRTSGTTGANLAVYDSEYDRANRMAFLDYIKFKNGVIPFSKRASFTGQELAPPNHNNKIWRYNWPMDQMLYATLYMEPDNMKHVYDSLKRFKPVSLDGLPSGIHMVARYILKHNIKIDWEVKAIFPTAEALLPHVKKDIEDAFHTTVIDQYSSAEGAPFIYGTKEGNYEIGDATGVIEFFKAGPELYDMVVTSFINDATPIVRYKIGDQVEMDSDKLYLNSFEDDCRITRIIGREGDYLYGNNGNKVYSVNVSWIMDEFEEKVPHIQFVQKEKELFIINIVVEAEFEKSDEEAMRDRMRRRLGADSHFIFNYLDAIPKEKSGKVRFIINEVE